MKREFSRCADITSSTQLVFLRRALSDVAENLVLSAMHEEVPLMSLFDFSPSELKDQGRLIDACNKSEGGSIEQSVQSCKWAFADENSNSTEDAELSTQDRAEDETVANAETQGISTDFINILRKVKSDIQNHHLHLAKNEGATRVTLVDPVLRALGWDTSNPDSAIVEARARRGPNTIFADYALRSGGFTRFVVEAKALGQSLESHRNQVVDYAFAFQINNVFLTNGIVWEHYINLNPSLLAPTKILDLRTDSLESIAYYLSQELHATPTVENEQVILHLYDKAEVLTAKLETVLNRIAVLETAHERHPLTSTLKSRIDTLKASLDAFTFAQEPETKQEHEITTVDLSKSALARAIIRIVENGGYSQVSQGGAIGPLPASNIYQILLREAALEAMDGTAYETTHGSDKERMMERAKEGIVKSRAFPANAIWMGRELTRISPGLRAAGVDAIRTLPRGGSHWEFKPVSEEVDNENEAGRE